MVRMCEELLVAYDNTYGAFISITKAELLNYMANTNCTVTTKRVEDPTDKEEKRIFVISRELAARGGRE